MRANTHTDPVECEMPTREGMKTFYKSGITIIERQKSWAHMPSQLNSMLDFLRETVGQDDTLKGGDHAGTEQ